MKLRAIVGTGLLAIGCFVASDATAGATYGSNSVQMLPHGARGSFTAVGNTADPNEYIMCGLRHDQALPFDPAYCYARDRNGEVFVCFADDPKLAAVIGTMTGDSDIEFHGDAGGLCTSIEVVHSSITPGRHW